MGCDKNIAIIFKKVLTNSCFYFIISFVVRNGGIAQLARAHGSYPWCQWFKSTYRYHVSASVVSFALIFCAKISVHRLRCASSAAKAHGESLGSLVNALAVALSPTNLLRERAFGAQLCGFSGKSYKNPRTKKRQARCLPIFIFALNLYYPKV